MSLNEMQDAWNSPRNNLPVEQHRALADRFTQQMRRRRRFQTAWLINTFVWLALVTVLAARALAEGKIQPVHQWALLPLIVVPWVFAIHFLRRHRKPIASTQPGALPIVDSLRAALDSNRATQSYLKLVGVLYVIVIPLLALTMRQLHAVGKASPRELASMAALFGGVLLICGTAIAARYFLRLRPQERQLHTLLTELTGG